MLKRFLYIVLISVIGALTESYIWSITNNHTLSYLLGWMISTIGILAINTDIEDKNETTK